MTDKIDKEISKGKSNLILDSRIKKISLNNYKNEIYQLFRLEFSNFINQSDNNNIKQKIEKNINDKKLNLDEKKIKIKEIIFKLIDVKLLKKYDNFINKNLKQTGGKSNKFIHIRNEIPNIDEYVIDNNRELCNINIDKNTCNSNLNCYWYNNNCYLSLTEKLIIEFVNKISEELSLDDLKSFEILQKKNYNVSDIVDYEKFKEKEGTKIIKTTGINLKKLLSNLFGNNKIPNIGKLILMLLMKN